MQKTSIRLVFESAISTSNAELCSKLLGDKVLVESVSKESGTAVKITISEQSKPESEFM